MYLVAVALICSAVINHAFTAIDSASVELQTQFLTSIYENVKDRQLKDGELNLLRNETEGFANAICSYAEKGTPRVTGGNRAMMFDLSMVSEAKESHVMMQLVIKTPTQQYFQAVRHLSLYKDCLNCPKASEQNLVAKHTLLDTDRERKWLELTVKCSSCNWEELDQISLVLQLTDDNDLPIAFTQETAVDMKTFLVLYTYNRSSFLYESMTKALEKREVSETSRSSMLENRTTIQELLDDNVTCSKHVMYLTEEEFQFRSVIAPIPSLIQFSYCFGECSSDLAMELPIFDNGTTYDSRTRILMQSLNEELYPPPCCIPKDLTPLQLIMEREEGVIELETIPNVVECKCQY